MKLLTEDGTVPPESPASDPRWLRERLEACIWRDDETPGRVIDVEILQRRWSAGGVNLLYQVSLRGADDRVLNQLYRGFEVRDERLLGRYELALTKAKTVPPLGRAVTLVPDGNLVLVAFPNDGRIRVLTDDDLRKWLAARATELANDGKAGPDWTLRDAEIEVLRYVPGQRLTMRCQGTFEAGGRERPFAYIVKQFGDRERAADIFRRLVMVAGYFGDSDAVRLPRAIASDAKLGLVLMEHLPGQELKQVLGQTDQEAVMRGVGAMLARLHQAPLVVDEEVTLADELQQLGRAADAIRRADPSLGPRVDAVVERCHAVRWTDDAPKALLHGACRLNHVLIDGSRLGLIDVDALCMGHPARDLGHFLSSLSYLEAEGHFSPSARQHWSRRLLEAYQAGVPWRLTPPAVLWFVAVLLVHKQARKYAVRLRADASEKVDRMLTISERALTGRERIGDAPSLEAMWDFLN